MDVTCGVRGFPAGAPHLPREDHKPLPDLVDIKNPPTWSPIGRRDGRGLNSIEADTRPGGEAPIAPSMLIVNDKLVAGDHPNSVA